MPNYSGYYYGNPYPELKDDIILNELLKPDPYCKKSFKSNSDLNHALTEKCLEKFVDIDYNREELENLFPFFKCFRLLGDDSGLFSYSYKKINTFFGEDFLSKGDSTISAYTINKIINIYNEFKFLNEDLEEE